MKILVLFPLVLVVTFVSLAILASSVFTFPNAYAVKLITVSIDKKSYSYGDHIKISGNAGNYLPTVPIRIVITDPSKYTVFETDTFITNASETYHSTIYAAGSNWHTSGNYKITTTFAPTSNQATISFYYDSTPIIPIIEKSRVLSDDTFEKWMRKIDSWVVNGDIPAYDALKPGLYLRDKGLVTQEQYSKIMFKLDFVNHAVQAFNKAHPELKNQLEFQLKSDAMFPIEVLKCERTPGGQYIEVGGQITNNDSIIHDPELTYQGVDKNGQIITFELGYAGEIQPGQTVFVDSMLTSYSSIVNCDIVLNQAN